MAITDESTTDLEVNGYSDWVLAGDPGKVVMVDCVDENGDSAAWGSVSVTLLYSIDGKMRSVLEDKNDGLIENRTAGFSKVLDASGYVSILASGISGQTVRLSVGRDSVS